MRAILLAGTGLAAMTLLASTGTQARAAMPSIRAQLAANAAPAVQDDSTVGFDILLPLRDEAGLASLIANQQNPASPQFHKWLTPAQFGERFGPGSAQLNRLAAVLRAQGVSVDVHTRSLHVSGTAAAVNALLATRLVTATLPSGARHTVAARAISLPSAISQAGGVVVAFDQHVHEAHSDVRSTGIVPGNRNSPTGAYWYDDLKQAYQYPAYTTMVTAASGTTQRLDGTGTTIALLMSSDALDSDVAAVFAHEKWSTTTGRPAPTLYAHIPVNGGCAVAGAPQACGAFDEASLDVQEAITGAPGAHVELYDIPSLSDSDIISGYLQIVEDNTADVVSSSFGGCELYYQPDYNDGQDYTYLLKLEHQLFEQGNAQGITFLASSGDEAGLECTSMSYLLDGENGTWIAGVSVPAADPDVTGVGGTNVVTTYTQGSLNSAYVGENAYSDPLIPYDPDQVGALAYGGYWGAGGGVSTYFRKPDYQYLVKTGSTTRRTVPDIGMQVGGCPAGISVLPCNGGDQPQNGNGNAQRSAVAVAVGGRFVGLIGTSVASPELASAVALGVELYGRFGNLNSILYAASAQQATLGNAPGAATTMLHTGIPGYNGVVTDNKPGPYYNYTTGVGTPIVYRLLGLPGAQTAGIPQTITNP